MQKKSLILLLFAFTLVNAQCDKPLRIHSHNDYQNGATLFSALKYCAKSIEADVHLINGKLFVAHDLDEVDNLKTLESLYLNPLVKIIEDNKSPYNFNYELFLLIDIKSNADSTYFVLNKLLEKYDPYLTYYQNKIVYIRKIRVILSGNRPIDIVSNMEQRKVFLDGRLSDINRNYSSDLYPLISESGEKVLEIINDPVEEIKYKNLENLIAKIHNENKLVRFWGVPDNQEYWEMQENYGIDLINTDNVIELSNFMSTQLKKAK